MKKNAVVARRLYQKLILCRDCLTPQYTRRATPGLSQAKCVNPSCERITSATLTDADLYAAYTDGSVEKVEMRKC